MWLVGWDLCSNALTHIGFVSGTDLRAWAIGTDLAGIHPDHTREMAYMLKQVGGDDNLL